MPTRPRLGSWRKTSPLSLALAWFLSPSNVEGGFYPELMCYWQRRGIGGITAFLGLLE